MDYVGAWLRKDKEEPPVDQSWYQTFNASRAAEHA